MIWREGAQRCTLHWTEREQLQFANIHTTHSTQFENWNVPRSGYVFIKKKMFILWKFNCIIKYVCQFELLLLWTFRIKCKNIFPYISRGFQITNSVATKLNTFSYRIYWKLIISDLQSWSLVCVFVSWKSFYWV